MTGTEAANPSEETQERKLPLGDPNIPRIYFANWNEDSRRAYLRAAVKNMEELQDDSDRRNTRMNTFMIVNGTVLGLVLAFVINSNLLQTPSMRWAGIIMVVGLAFLISSFVLLVWTSSEAKDAPVMDFWVGANPELWDYIDNPIFLREDLINGFLMRCQDLRETLERTVDKIQMCGRIFSIGLIIIMVSVVCALLFYPAAL